MLETYQQDAEPTSVYDDPVLLTTETGNQRVPIGTHLQVIGDDEDEEENLTVPHHPKPQLVTSNHRYPQRERRPPVRCNDFVSH